LEEELARATALAKLYEATPVERARRDEATQLRTALETAQATLAQTEQAVKTLDTEQTTREKELYELISQLNPLVGQLQTELRHMRNAREEAKRTLIEQEYTAKLQEYHTYNERIKEIEADLEAARQDRQAFIKDAIGCFRDWQDLNNKIYEDLPVVCLIDDPTLRVIESSIHFFETLLRERFGLKEQHQMRLPIIQSLNYAWWSLFVVDAPDLNYINDRSVTKERLVNKLAALKRLQSEYTESLVKEMR
jgi:multidrug efflux pump subunit AcrA (membrane-fusion protein)